MEGFIIGSMASKSSAAFRRTIPSYEMALEAFREARYFDALDHLRHLPPTTRSEALQLRMLLRLGRLEDARNTIARNGAMLSGGATEGERAVLCALAGRVYELAGNKEIARQWYGNAYEHSLRSDESELIAEAHYTFAMNAFSERDLTRFELHVADVMRSEQPWLRALAQAMRGFAASYEQDYQRALNAYESAVLLFASEGRAQDRWAEAICLRQYIGLIHTMDAGTSALAALTCYEAFPWTEELARVRFEAAIDLVELLSSSDDDIRTYRMLREAEDAALDMPALLIVRSTRCIQAERDGEHKFAVNELGAAGALYRKIDWAAAGADQRLALLVFAVAAATLNPVLADAAVGHYRSQKAALTAEQRLVLDARLTPLEDYLCGLVAAAQGNRAEAIRLLRASHIGSRSVGYRFYENRAAEALRSLGVEAPDRAPPPPLSGSQRRDVVELFLPQSQNTTS
jgi:hypothetical protein